MSMSRKLIRSVMRELASRKRTNTPAKLASLQRARAAKAAKMEAGK